jgi:DNA-binding MarR family transcriptional regulator
VLRVLGEHARDPAGVETGRVAREALLLGPSLTGVLTRMERDGLITRKRCPQDARRTVVRATPAGLGWCASCRRPSSRTTSGWRRSWARRSWRSCMTLLDDVIALEAPGGVEADEIEE